MIDGGRYETKRIKRIPVYRFFRVKSTFDYAKSKKDKGKDLFVVATTQSQGRGRNGRVFSSTRGGLYLTWLHFPQNLSAQNAFCLIRQAAVAVCKTLESYGVSPTIKWPNDILVNGKKIGGILTENTLKGGLIASSLIGIGVNIHNRLEEELRPIATTLQEVISKKIPVREVEKTLRKNLYLPYAKEAYFARLSYLGEVEIVEGEKRYPAFAEGVDEEGLLMVVVDGVRQKKSAAEISLRQRMDI